MNRIPQVLLDDLRNATEFYKCVQEEASANCAEAGDLVDASEWLRTAALNLGEALIAAHAAGEVPHA